MSDGSMIDLPSVVQRFRESSEALHTLRERLERLEKSTTIQERAAQSIGAAAGELGALTNQARALSEALSEVALASRNSLEAAEQFLRQTDLSGLHEGMSAVASKLDRVDLASLTRSIEAVDSRLEDVDLPAMNAAVQSVAQRVEAIDLSGMEDLLRGVAAALQSADLGGLRSDLRAVVSAVGSVDLVAMHESVRGIATGLSRLRTELERDLRAIRNLGEGSEQRDAAMARRLTALEELMTKQLEAARSETAAAVIAKAAAESKLAAIPLKYRSKLGF